MKWSARLEVHPVKVPNGKTVSTLDQARRYILTLPAREQKRYDWQRAAAELIKAAEHGGPFLMLARIAFATAALDRSTTPKIPRTPKGERWKAPRKARTA